MRGIDALEGFLPRRYKERHVFIRELVACLDDLDAAPTGARPAPSREPVPTLLAVAD